MKGKEWLVKEVDRLRLENTLSNNPMMISNRDVIAKVSRLIDQLEEPEITENKAWKVIELENSYHLAPAHMKIYKEAIQNGVKPECFNEPEKPVIPQFVADWIEKWKDQGLAMYEWFSFDFDNKEDVEVNNWLYYDNDCEENKRREYLFIDAIRYGYEVEKEILWEIPMPNLKTTSGHIQYLTYNPKARTYFASRKNEKSKQTFNAKDLASVPEQYRHYAELCDFKKIQEVTE